jgi:hypothetical protein
MSKSPVNQTRMPLVSVHHLSDPSGRHIEFRQTRDYDLTMQNFA